MLYCTTTGNYYLFHNGRVTCYPHDLINEPVYNVAIHENGIQFRTSAGWWLTTPIVQIITSPDELILVA